MEDRADLQSDMDMGNLCDWLDLPKWTWLSTKIYASHASFGAPTVHTLTTKKTISGVCHRPQRDVGVTVTKNNIDRSYWLHIYQPKRGFIERKCSRTCPVTPFRKPFRSLFGYYNQLWADQSISRNSLLIEVIQPRATKLITKYSNASYMDCLLPLNCWLEYLDLIFLKCKVRRHIGSLINDDGNGNEHS